MHGLLIYLIYGWITQLVPDEWGLPYVNLLSPGSRREVASSPAALTLAAGIGVVLSGLTAALINHRVLHKVARTLRITNKFGDPDVWTYLMNSNETDWLVVRNPAQQLFYVGKIAVYSDEEDIREVVLVDTTVYDNMTGDEKYDAGIVYFSFSQEGITLEFPSRSDSNGKG